MTVSLSSVSFHSMALCLHTFAVYYHIVYMSPIESKLRGYEFGGSLIYLTIITNITQIFYYTITVINSFTQSKAIRKFSDFLFASLVTPLGLLVFAMYWALNCFGNDLVFPVARDISQRFPRWLNFVLHTNVALAPMVDMMISKHRYPNRYSGIAVLLAVLVNYLGVLILVKLKTNHWVYGILGKCDDIQRTFVIGGCGVIAIFFFLFGEMCNKTVCIVEEPKRKDDKEKTEKTK